MSSEVFMPARIRGIPRHYRKQMFAKPTPKLESWCKRETDRCRESFLYFIQSYGSIEPPAGAPEVFNLWECQKSVCQAFLEHEVNVILKARRLGLSWLALHFAAWICLFDTEMFGPGARVIIICKNEDDAKKLLQRVKRIYERLPFYLRPELDIDNTKELGIRATGSIVTSLPATDRAARQETATLFILDEFAFPKDGAAHGIWTSVLPTIEGGGRGIVISTGNGRSGDGATFATVWDRSYSGVTKHNPIFLGWFERPGRDQAWYEETKAQFISVDDFFAEYPADPDQALISSIDPSVYSYAGIAAAEAIGGILDDYYKFALMDGVDVGIDWGDFQTFACYSINLGSGSGWVADELVQMRTEATRAARGILDREIAGLSPGIRSTHGDSNPPGTNRTFADVLRDYHDDQPSSFPDRHVTWKFSQIKEGGSANQRFGVDTVAYIQHLFHNSQVLWEEIRESTDPYEQLRQITRRPLCIAISPRCKILLHQLRELKRDPENGKVLKALLSPSDPLSGDHGPDALIALFAERAANYTATMQEVTG